MSSKLEPAIQSHDTGHQIACFDSCQLTIRWMHKIKDVAMVMVLLSYFIGVVKQFANWASSLEY